MSQVEEYIKKRKATDASFADGFESGDFLRWSTSVP